MEWLRSTPYFTAPAILELMTSDELLHPQDDKPHCPKCEAVLQIKSSKSGPFWACTAYPSCDYTKPLKSKADVSIMKVLDDVCCPECEGDLAVKSGKFGMFIGCLNYPVCNFIVKETDDDDYKPVPCPNCGKGELHQRSGKKGKTFYACDQYPKCDFLLNERPVAKSCPSCHFEFLTQSKDRLKCPNSICDYQEQTNKD